MNRKLIFTFTFFVILLFPNVIQDSVSLRQVAGQINVDIKPGETSEFNWGLASDNPNQITTVELSAEGEGSEFLKFEKNVNIDPLKTVLTKVQVNIPKDYPGGIELTPHLIATELGEKGGATVINIRMLKIVNLNIDLNDDPNLWVDWDAIRAQKMDAEPQTKQESKQGEGLTILQADKSDESDNGGGCLIATATYGTELAYQVQMLREIRDDTLLSTASGTSFMIGFNQLYYTLSPTISDWERQNPLFKETVKMFITPLISSLSIMSLAEHGSEELVLGLGISVIALNAGMYIAAPAVITHKVYKLFKNKANSLF